MLKPKQSSFRASKSKLIRARKNFRSYIIRESKEMSKLMQRYARLMSPRETMSLEQAIMSECLVVGDKISIKLYVDENHSVARRPRYTVGQYATIMHKGDYNLGKISAIKNRTLSGSGMYVGKGYLNRAGHLVWDKKKDAMYRAAKSAMGGL